MKLDCKWLALGTCLALMACGSADFSGGGDLSLDGAAEDTGGDNALEPDENVDSTGGGGDAKAGGSPLRWHFPCEPANPRSGEINSEDIEGGGQHTAPQPDSSYRLTFSGEFCKDVDPPKDIVFMIDASASMRNADPTVNGTCGRLQALERLINTFGEDGSHRYAVETFANDHEAGSSDFFETRQKLYDDLLARTGKSAIGDVLCHTELGTDYDEGFAAVAPMIRGQARSEATSTIILLSDGKPLFGQTGESIATSLKSQGTVIGTIVLNGRSDILRDRLASRDAAGFPLFRSIGSIDSLGRALVDLTKRVDAPAQLEYKPVQGGQWQTKTLDQGKKNFELGPIGVTPSAFPGGIQVRYQYDLPKQKGRKTVEGRISYPKSR